MRQLCKGNVAVVKGAMLAGCRAFYGYPITPASEIAEYAALYLPQIGGTFLQAESEVSAINMVYGAASAGLRVMTASSGPGISLMQEGISYLAGAELPCVIVDVMRGGPGLGNIAAEQSDYFAMVKGGGHGNYRNIVLAPASVQEMAELTMLAFELADKYRNPTIVLADGFVGQMMEPLELEDRELTAHQKTWAVKGTQETRGNLISSIFLSADELEEHERRLEAKYIRAEKAEARFESYRTEDAEILLVGFGIVSRVLLSAVEALRREGVRAGMFRPITLWPYPSEALVKAAAHVHSVLAVELSNGQMVEDVRVALNGRVPVEFYGRVGGNVPSVGEVQDAVAAAIMKHHPDHVAPRPTAARQPLTAESAEYAETKIKSLTAKDAKIAKAEAKASTADGALRSRSGQAPDAETEAKPLTAKDAKIAKAEAKTVTAESAEYAELGTEEKFIDLFSMVV